MEYVITFKNTNIAMKAEQRLLEHGLNVGVMPLPAQISAGCGICLRVLPDDIKLAQEALLNEGIEIVLYTRVAQDKKYVYDELKDGKILQ